MDKNSSIKLLQKLYNQKLSNSLELKEATMMNLFNLPQEYVNKILNLSDQQIMSINAVNGKKLELILDKYELLDKFEVDFKNNCIFDIICKIINSSFGKKDAQFLFEQGINYISLCKEEWQAEFHEKIFDAVIRAKNKNILNLSTDINNCNEKWQGELIVELLHNIGKIDIMNIIESSKIIPKCNKYYWQYSRIYDSYSNETLIKQKILPDFIRLISECKEDWRGYYINLLSWDETILISSKFLKLANLFFECSSEYSAQFLYNRINDKYCRKQEQETKKNMVINANCLCALDELPDDTDVSFDDIAIFNKINVSTTSDDLEAFQKFNRL